MEVRRSREQWSSLVEALRASGQPLGVFASHVGVNARSHVRLAAGRYRTVVRDPASDAPTHAAVPPKA